MTFHKKIVLLLENTPWGKSNEKAIRKSVSESRNLVLTRWFNWGEKNFKKDLEAFKRVDADVIIYVGNAPEAVHVLKTMYATGIKFPIVSHWGITGGKFWGLAKKYLEEIDLRFLQTFIINDKEKIESQRFFKRYRDYFSLDDDYVIPAPFGTIHAYDLVHIFAEALNRAGKFDRELLRKQLGLMVR